jgi:hypothetical protein
MNCPHCHKVLPENYAASYCPHCGGAVQMAEPAFYSSGTPAVAPIKISWLIFFGVLLAPLLLTILVVLLSGPHTNEQFSPIIAFFGGAGAGIVCGVMLALRLGKSMGARVGLGVLFACIFAVLGIMLSCFGCLAAGYTLNVK